MNDHHDLCPCADEDSRSPICECAALDAAGVKRGSDLALPAGREVIATDVQPSDERGAWTCGLCGFRGFWRGGPHCTNCMEVSRG